ncbi:ficolin-1 [Culex quinquefasciatus]|uniref:ficolin-1 n=1 Tax=Culex quinquefasciatus TaxID=7176 RepID=UPI0018E35253|nr:ficolin-1 [Culex quinquefasciatus]
MKFAVLALLAYFLVVLSENLSEEKISERIAKLETLGEILTQNQKSLNNQIGVIESSLSLITDNTRKILDNQLEKIPAISSCKEPLKSGIFRLRNPKLKVYCEMDSFDGDWLVIQQRVDYTLSFNRSWAEYRDGFGTVGKESEFWLGLEAVHQITKDGSCELAVDLKDQSGHYQYARYSSFGLAGEDHRYRLTVGGYSGTAFYNFVKLNNYSFMTYDFGSDIIDQKICYLHLSSGWWYCNCNCNLNYPSTYRNDECTKFSYSRMMIRCE